MFCSRCNKLIDNDKYKHCNKCREYNKLYRDNIPRIYKQGEFSSKNNLTKVCSDCKNEKLLDEFYKNIRYKDGYRNHCKPCHSIRWKNYYNCKYKDILKDKFNSDIVYKLKQNQRSYIFQQLKIQS